MMNNKKDVQMKPNQRDVGEIQASTQQRMADT
jgi:hypothetical protein